MKNSMCDRCQHLGSEEALFQINVMRIALWDRVAPLKRDADVAGKDAWARASGKAEPLALGRRCGGVRPSSPTLMQASWRSSAGTRCAPCANRAA